ncbi:hypothetical protein pb186bvf_004031 [Paramecium bursaria]
MPPKKVVKEPDVVIPNGDPAAGRGIFDAQCSACHALEGDDKTASAPSLGGVIGRKAGSTQFPYSKAMKSMPFEWSDKHLFVFLKNPGKYVVGTKMAFAGLENEKDRADLIAYLNGG